MRLTDKDVLEEAVQGAINIMESRGISMIAASVPLAIIKGAPTIDAIPVEWLVNLKNEYAREGREQAEGDLMNLLLMWQKEQEAR